MSESKVLVRRCDVEAQAVVACFPELETLAPAQRAVLEGFLRRQVESEDTLRRGLAEMNRMLLQMEETNRRLQRMVETRVTVTAAQTRALTHSVAARARALCEENRLDYAACGRRLREAITRDVKQTFTVPDTADLPATVLEAAGRFIADWSSFRLVRELRAKSRGGEEQR